MPHLPLPGEGTGQSPTLDPPPDMLAETAAFFDRFIRLAALPLGVVFSLTSLFIFLALLLNGLGITHADLGPNWHDFQSFWSAGVAATHGQGGKLYDFVWHSAHIKQIFGSEGQDFGWHYPPQFLLVLAPLTALPLPLAFTLWFLLPLAGFAWLIYRLIPDWRAPLIALGCPVTIVNTGYMQNGVLSAALIGLALLPFVENKRPSAINTSLLAFKPHLGLVFPVAFAAGRLWTTIAVTVLCLAVQAGLTALVFGPQIWLDFWGSLAQSKTILLSEIGAGNHHYASVFGSVRLLGGPTSWAYLAQILSAGLVLYALWSIWRPDTPRPLKAALLVASIPLTAPYLMHYDMVMSVLAGVLLIRQRRFELWEQRDRFLLAGLWLSTTFNHGLQKDYAIPSAVIGNLLLYSLVYRTILSEQARSNGNAIIRSAASGPGSAH